MNVALLYDNGNADGTKGGAELTMQDFAAACPPGAAITDLKKAETVVVGNCVQFDAGLIPQLIDKRVIRYHHDLARHENEILRAWLDDNAEHIFTSPLHRHRYSVQWDHGERECHIIPPALDLDRFRPNRQTRRQGRREGIVTVASWQNQGKGGQLLGEVLASEGLTADCFGPGPFHPTSNVTLMGGATQAELPSILQRYETFMFLPVSPEPFGRCVVEAWAAGCDLRVNENVGALWFIRNDPGALDAAGENFWRLILG